MKGIKYTSIMARLHAVNSKFSNHMKDMFLHLNVYSYM